MALGKKTKKNVLLLLPIMFLGVLFFETHQKTQQYASGNIIYASPGDNLAQKVNALSPGDTLYLNDGIYSNSQLLVQDKHGTASSHITIAALHDGKAIIDGGKNANYPDVILVDNSTYIDIAGMAARNSAGGVVAVVNPSSFVTIKRVTGYNAGTGNVHVFSTEPWGSGNPSNILFEDDAGWGNGRYVYSAYHATNVTFRRCYAYWTSQSNFSPAPRAPFNVYGSTNVLLENDIGKHGIPDQNSTDYFTSDWQTTDGPPQDNATYLGIMFFDNWEGLWVNGSAGNNTIIKNSYFENTRKQGSFTTNRNHGDAIMWGTNNGIGGSVDTSTFVNNEVGFSKQTSQNPTLSSSIFLNNTTAITGNQSHTYTDFFGNGSLGTTVGSTDKQVDPGFDTAKYGNGAYLFIPNTSPLKHAGPNGSDIGANIIYEYVNGQLTNTPLWPWPMEDRIKSESGLSITWESAGGLWKTLDGVYGSGGPTPPPTGTSTPTATPAPICMTLSLGASGPDVIQLQTLLNNHGANLTVDGQFGTMTQQAVQSFQTSQGLSATGVVDNATWTALGVQCNSSGTQLQVTVCLHDTGNCGDNVNPNSGGNTSPKHTTRTTTLTLLNKSGQQAASSQGTIAYMQSAQNFQGSIPIPNISSGQYLVSVKTDGFLSKQVPGIITVMQGQITTIPSISETTGDINNDDQLDLLDYNILISCFGSKQSTSSCTNPPTQTSPGADINDDGKVDGIDYNEFLRELSVQKGF